MTDWLYLRIRTLGKHLAIGSAGLVEVALGSFRDRATALDLLGSSLLGRSIFLVVLLQNCLMRGTGGSGELSSLSEAGAGESIGHQIGLSLQSLSLRMAKQGRLPTFETGRVGALLAAFALAAWC
jgi:hypothetical protein